MSKQNEPLVTHIHTADPSAHVFEDKLYIYPSHDLEHNGEDNDNGDQYKMEDYHILSMDDVDVPCVDNGEALHMKNVPWVSGQMWATDAPAIGPRVAKLSEDMLSFEEAPEEIVILDENGNPITAGDEERRYFEGPWMHKYNGKYYFSYSTGTTHYLAYAIGDSPKGPFTYQGKILDPVIGWTTHHSIVEFKGKWYLFYHDSSLSGGVNHKRCVKFRELKYNPDGTIIPMKPYED